MRAQSTAPSRPGAGDEPVPCGYFAAFVPTPFLRGLRTAAALTPVGFVTVPCLTCSAGGHHPPAAAQREHAIRLAVRELGNIAMEGSVDAAFRGELEGAADPDAMRLEILKQLRRSQSPMRTAEHFGIEEVIDRRETRPRLRRWITGAQRLLPDIAHERGRPMRP
jgi:hypothetical protein